MVGPGDLGRPRPAVIVQTDDLGEAPASVIVCPITSYLTEKLPIRPMVEPSAANGLRVQSQIMTDKMIALRRDRLKRVIGHLETAASGELDRALLIVLGLTR
jgi:mRNA interferase MazF